MSKIFSASSRHAKAWEFLELKQGFTELARFGDDYVATDMAKVRNFEDCLNFPILG